MLYALYMTIHTYLQFVGYMDDIVNVEFFEISLILYNCSTILVLTDLANVSHKY